MDPIVEESVLSQFLVQGVAPHEFGVQVNQPPLRRGGRFRPELDDLLRSGEAERTGLEIIAHPAIANLIGQARFAA